MIPDRDFFIREDRIRRNIRRVPWVCFGLIAMLIAARIVYAYWDSIRVINIF